MLELRRASERSVAEFGWLASRHTFSFGHYHDPRQVGFFDLPVINDDRVAPGMGFGTHPHHDMEIFSSVLEGALEHKDSMGNGSVIRPGEVQMMSAGSGVSHSEFNPSRAEAVRFLQIWIAPDRLHVAPRRAAGQWHRSGSRRRCPRAQCRHPGVRRRTRCQGAGLQPATERTAGALTATANIACGHDRLLARTRRRGRLAGNA